MTIAIVYATHHGHTRRVCQRLAEGLRTRGYASKLYNVDKLPEEFGFTGLEAAVLAGSVQFGRHPRSLIRLAREHRDALAAIPSAFVSVNLWSSDPKALPEARRALEEFAETTGWRPPIAESIPGALLYSRYNPVLRFVMKMMARTAGTAADTTRDHVYTDWDEVDRLAERIADITSARSAEEAEIQAEEPPLSPPPRTA